MNRGIPMTPEESKALEERTVVEPLQLTRTRVCSYLTIKASELLEAYIEEIRNNAVVEYDSETEKIRLEYNNTQIASLRYESGEIEFSNS